ncbi:hypothetical protein NP511_17615 [Natrinema thermotolerans]|uniref:Uncharacterized protein n=1 Tax=Natrinema thermotolerans TaxID=121872 RepID=A0AAF0P876_9EURY|nr:hypothetical protein [Natrinema thermotolerans]QCC60179.1 hypothetical protein DVR14_16705 [Natrinema thermotolerans]QCC61090.1 hypothetical protein DVR14_20825 [Natrinema thermotolerans]WMT07193.1 hypothetical protein NP511_17615 [Natrinema thermotolerans]
MNLGHMARLEDFGTRSLVTHAIMATTFAGAIVSGLFIDGQIGLVSFVAFLNFTAGVWVAQSTHSLGNARTDDSYDGILSVLADTTGEKSYRGLDTGRLARLLTLIAVVTAVSLLVSGEVLSGTVASIGAVAIGVVALVTAMVGFLIAMSSAYDASERERMRTVERDSSEPGGTDRSSGELEDGSDIRISIRESHVDEPASEYR